MISWAAYDRSGARFSGGNDWLTFPLYENECWTLPMGPREKNMNTIVV
jgi:hypothetical protein